VPSPMKLSAAMFRMALPASSAARQAVGRFTELVQRFSQLQDAQLLSGNLRFSGHGFFLGCHFAPSRGKPTYTA